MKNDITKFKNEPPKTLPIKNAIPIKDTKPKANEKDSNKLLL